MDAPKFTLTEGDGALLTDARRVDHPMVFAPLLDRLPDDTRGMKVVAAYEIALDDPRGKGSCASCHHPKNHRSGLILELADGSHASMGRNCGENKFDYKHRELIESFDKGTNRGEALRRARLAIDRLLPATAYVAALPSLPQVEGFEKFRVEFERRFGKLYNALQGSKGRLYLKVWVIDDERMIARKRRRDDKADRYVKRVSERSGQEPTRAEVEAHFAGDDDFSTEVLQRQEEREAATFTGSFLFTRLGRLESEVNSLVRRMSRALMNLDGVTSDKIALDALQAMVRQFTKAVADAMKLVDDLNEIATLFDPENLSEIVRWANMRTAVGIGGVYKVESGALICEFSSPPHWRLTIPEVLPVISRGPLPAILAEVSRTNATIDVASSIASVA